MNTVNENILEVQHLKKYFPVKGGFIQHTLGYVQAVDDISFTIRAGRVLGMVGAVSYTHLDVYKRQLLR